MLHYDDNNYAATKLGQDKFKSEKLTQAYSWSGMPNTNEAVQSLENIVYQTNLHKKNWEQWILFFLLQFNDVHVCFSLMGQQ
jgi:uncharacterized protein YqcC (DUF446 family)